MRRLFILFSILITLSGCAPKGNNSPKAKPFPKVPIPAMISSQEEIMKFVAKNYWNKFFDSTSVYSKDTSFIGGVSKVDFANAFNEYVNLLFMIPTSNALDAQRILISKAEALEKADSTSNVFEAICDISGFALYGVNSNYRNEELYLPIAQALSISPLIDDVLKTKYAKEASDCSLNRLGEVATNFGYTSSKGKTSSLHQIKSEYTLLFFSNPGCTACKEIIDTFKASQKITLLEEQGRLKVLNMYIDEDLTEWFKYMPIYPDNWINAYDPNYVIRSSGIYSVRAIPSLYLLDKEKRVIYKDAPPQVILRALENL